MTLTRPDKAAKNTDEAMETAEVTKIHKFRVMREELPAAGGTRDTK